MIDTKKSYVKDTRRSFSRRMISYVVLGIITILPLGMYYLPSAADFLAIKISLFNWSLNGVTVGFFLDMYLFPTVLSSIVGAGGGFVLWCYYTRARCLDDQLPSGVLLGI